MLCNDSDGVVEGGAPGDEADAKRKQTRTAGKRCAEEVCSFLALGVKAGGVGTAGEESKTSYCMSAS